MQAKVRVLAPQRRRMTACCLYIGGAHDFPLPEPVKGMIVLRNYLDRMNVGSMAFAPLRTQGARARIGHLMLVLAPLLLGFQYTADEWITDCAVERQSGDCSIIGVFRGSSKTGTSGSFSLAVDLQSGIVAVVGTPHPSKAIIRVDKGAPIHCTSEPYCLVSSSESQTLIDELTAGNVVLLDVFAGRNTFLLSASTQGFRAGFNKIRAYRDLIH